MKIHLENLLYAFSDMEAFGCDDKLSKLVNDYLDNELDIDQLDDVSAAASADYSHFQEFLNRFPPS